MSLVGVTSYFHLDMSACFSKVSKGTLDWIQGFLPGHWAYRLGLWLRAPTLEILASSRALYTSKPPCSAFSWKSSAFRLNQRANTWIYRNTRYCLRVSHKSRGLKVASSWILESTRSEGSKMSPLRGASYRASLCTPFLEFWFSSALRGQELRRKTQDFGT